MNSCWCFSVFLNNGLKFVPFAKMFINFCKKTNNVLAEKPFIISAFLSFCLIDLTIANFCSHYQPPGGTNLCWGVSMHSQPECMWVVVFLQCYSSSTGSNRAAMPATVGDCLELRSQLTTDAYTLTPSVNSREATFIPSHLSFPHKALIFTTKDKKRISYRVSTPLCFTSSNRYQQRITECLVISDFVFRSYLEDIHNRVQATWTHFW